MQETTSSVILPARRSRRNFFLIGFLALVGIVIYRYEAFEQRYFLMTDSQQWVVLGVGLFFFLLFIVLFIDMSISRITMDEEGITGKGILKKFHMSYEELNTVYFQKTIKDELIKSKWLKKGDLVIPSDYKNQEEGMEFLKAKGIEVKS